MTGFVEKQDWGPGQPVPAPISFAQIGGSSLHPGILAATKRAEKIPMDILILSTPRSASRFLVKVLRNCGVKIGHEGFKKRGTCGMFFAVEDVWYPGKHWYNDEDDESRQRRSDYEFKQVWHMVRDPRKVIPSCAFHHLPGSIWCWQERHTGISSGLYPKMLRSMLFWVAWNELIEQNEKIDLFFRIEDLDSHWEDVCQRLSIEPGTTIPEIPMDYGTTETGPRAPKPLNFDEMEAIDLETAKRVREMAERYGYDFNKPLEVTV